MNAARKRVISDDNLVVVTHTMNEYLHGKRVLLAGANEVDEMLVRYMVVEHGGILNVVTNEEAMRRTLSTSRYDLILMNSRLDMENSIGILARFREDNLVKAPVIALSSNDMMGRGLHNGFAHVLHRPLEKKKVLHALSTVLPLK